MKHKTSRGSKVNFYFCLALSLIDEERISSKGWHTHLLGVSNRLGIMFITAMIPQKRIFCPFGFQIRFWSISFHQNMLVRLYFAG